MSLPKAAFDILEAESERFLDLRPNFYMSGELMVAALVSGIKAARMQCEIEISDTIPSPEALRFESLRRIARLGRIRMLDQMERRNIRY